MKSIEFNGQTYYVPRLTPWDAFHVMRRLSPVLVGIGPQILGLALTKDDSERAANILSAIFGDSGLRFAQMLSMIPDADMDFCAVTCLRGVTVQQRESRAKVLTEGVSRPLPMFPFITLPVILRLVTEVLKEELTDFLTASRFSEAGETPTIT